MVELIRNDRSVKDNKEKNSLDVGLVHTSKLLHDIDINDYIDNNEVYKAEFKNADRYRLILTINPFCTNSLINPFTEIIKQEKNKTFYLTDIETIKVKSDKVFGKININRGDAIRNSEYSKKGVDFEYRLGLDILNNHKIRNRSFKEVCFNKDINDKIKFNTIEDYQRRANGNKQALYIRENVNDSLEELGKRKEHLYTKNDILTFEESIRDNIEVENGWYGIKNIETIITKDKKNESIGVEKIISNVDKEIIDFYPNRELFGFNSVFNKENGVFNENWDITITYPSEKFYNHELIQYKNHNSLMLLNIEKKDGDVYKVRSALKHNLKNNDYIQLFYIDKEEGNIHILEDNIRVNKLRADDNEDKEFYFLIRDFDIIDKLIEVGRITRDEVYDNNDLLLEKANKTLSNIQFRIRKIKANQPVEYYFRCFRVLPRQAHIDYFYTEGLYGYKTLKDFMENNFNDGDNITIPLEREKYPLAFAKTIYNDDITQITFTDDLSIKNLTDHRGRKLSELYVTIIKRNKGAKKYYGDGIVNDLDVEKSYCFGLVSSGVELSNSKTDKNDKIKRIKASLSDISLINNVKKGDGNNLYNSKSLEESISSKGGIKDNLYLGDIVELDLVEDKETILSDVYHRFNTYQRENNIKVINNFFYDELVSDDYDRDGFIVEQRHLVYNEQTFFNDGVDDKYHKLKIIRVEERGKYKIDNETLSLNIRPEGYYYKPHYKIKIAREGNIEQSSHYDIEISEAKKIFLEKDMIVLKSVLKHKLSIGNTIFLCDDDNNLTYKSKVVYIENEVKFIINKFYDENNRPLNIDIVIEKINNGDYLIRQENELIPQNANKIGANKYVWREQEKIEKGFIFSNGVLYCNKNINFFLKRQDPYGKGGLYYKGLFSDIKLSEDREKEIIVNEENYLC